MSSSFKFDKRERERENERERIWSKYSSIDLVRKQSNVTVNVLLRKSIFQKLVLSV